MSTNASVNSMPECDLFYAVYDDLFADKDYAREVRLVLELGLGDVPAPARILEIGAGTGNHSFACAGLGHEITAVEIDGNMMRMLRAKLEQGTPELAARIHPFAGKVESMAKGRFDLAMAMFNVVNYLPDLDSLLSFMRGVADRLSPGRGFVFDAWNGVAALLDPPKARQQVVETPTHRINLSLAGKCDRMRLSVLLTYNIERTAKADGLVETGVYCMEHRLWPSQVLLEAARMAGFELVGLYPLLDTSRIATESDWKVMFHCRKKRGTTQ